MEGLEFFTSEQLIQELMNRTTFAGIVLYSPISQTQYEQCHEHFCLLTKAEPEDTLAILIKAASAVEQGLQ